MRMILRFLVSLFEAFLRALLRAPRQTAEDASPQRALRARLQSKIRKSWSPRALWPTLLLVMLPACATRTVYVPDGTPVRLRETVRNAKVWVLDESGEPVPGEMDLPEGWYCLADERDRRVCERRSGLITVFDGRHAVNEEGIGERQIGLSSGELNRERSPLEAGR